MIRQTPMNGSPPNVTVGMPVYNAERYLAEAVDSVLAQTYGAYEIVLCDNASTDSTPSICREFVRRDPRIRFQASESNRGAAWNYNRAFDSCKTPYFMWMAYDDRLRPTFLERATATLTENPNVALCYSRTSFIDENGTELKVADDDFHLDEPSPVARFRRFLHRYRSPDFCNPIFGLFRTSALSKTAVIGPYPSSDMVLLGEIALHGQVFELPDVLFERRDHPERSVRKHPSPEQRAEWFVPGSGDKKQYLEHRWFLEYAKAIYRAKLSPGDTLGCTKAVLVAYMPRLRSTLNRQTQKVRKALKF